jgi:potassium-dependent mechanosensitive channel
VTALGKPSRHGDATARARRARSRRAPASVHARGHRARALTVALTCVATFGLAADLASRSCAGFGASAVAAQTPAPSASPPLSPTTAQIAPIPVPKIAELLDLTLNDVRGLSARLLEQPASVAEIQRDLPAFRESSAKLDLDPRLVPGARLTPRDIDDLEVQWLRGRDQLGAWMRILSDDLQNVEAGLDQLDSLDKSWAKTVESSRRADIPPQLVDRIREAQAQIEADRTKLRERRGTLLALQAEIGALQARTADHLAEMENVRASRHRDLLTADAPPLWRALSGGLAEGLIGRPVQNAWRRGQTEVPLYFAAHRPRFVLHAVFAIAALLLMLELRKRSRTWRRDEDDALARAVLLLERPFAAAALCTFLAGIVIYVYPPPALLEALFFAIALSVVRLMRAGIFGHVRGPLLALIAILLIATLRELIDTLSPAARILLLLEDAAMLATHYWFARQTEPSDPAVALAPWEWRLMRRFGGVVGPPAVAVAIVANLLGNVTLAEEITQLLLAAAYLGVVAYTAGILLGAVLIGVMHTGFARSFGVVQKHDEGLRHQVGIVLRTGMFAFWLIATLFSSDLLDPMWDWLGRVLGSGAKLGALNVSLGGVLSFAAMIVAALWLARTTRLLLDEEILPRLSLPRGVPNAISATANYVVLLVGFLIAISAAGFDLSDLALVAGALGVGIGFGLQNVVNNFISGLILIFERPIQIGDLIELGTTIGEVKHIGIRSSRIRTFEGAEVIVPNAQLIAERVVNWTFTDQQRRIELPVGVAYGTNPQQVIDLLIAVARANPDVLHYPPPVALLSGFGDSALNFALRAWTTRQDNIAVVRSQIAIAVHEALRDAGIEIPFPQRDVRLVTDAAPARVGPAEGASEDDRGNGEDARAASRGEQKR